MKHLVDRVFVYVKLYICYIKLNTAVGMAYRWDFIVGLVINTAGALVLVYFYEVVFDNVEVLGAWSKKEAMLLVGSYIIVESLYIGLAFHSISVLPYLIVSGDLDAHLLRPISTRASLMLRKIDCGSLVNGLLGVVLILIYAPSIPVWETCNVIVTLLLGFFFLSTILFMLMSLAFWLGRIDELRDMWAWIIELASKPSFIYPSLIKNIFYWVLPMFLIANVPVEVFSGQRSNILAFVPTVIPSYLLSRYIWYWGLRKYQSASH